MPGTEPTTGRPSRAPLLAHLTGLVVLLLVLGLLTFSPPPSSPPAIAEIAPAAVEQITKAPSEQAVDAGGTSGSIGARGRGPRPKPSPSGTLPPLATDAPSAPSPFTCVGKLPRQIEDPQSPPCVPFFKGDNGGATYAGVTASTINVTVPDLPAFHPILRAYEGFFNRRFQLYGRKLNLIGTSGEFDATGSEAASQQALAARAADEHKAFATLSLNQFQGTTYYREMARRGRLAISAVGPYTEQMLTQLRPYVWQYPMSVDKAQAVAGDWLCDRIWGKNADYTKDPALFGRRRVLGLIYSDTSGSRFTPDILTRGVKACGASFAAVKHLESNQERTATDNTAYSEDPAVRSAVIAMKDAEVTSVVCLCETSVLGPVGDFAGRQDYHPEWLVTTYLEQEVIAAQQLSNRNVAQKEGLLGISFTPRLIRAADDPSVWAIREQDSSAFTTSQDGSGLRQVNLHRTYRGLLLLASGIQLAGPNLTPATFERGLHAATFPNPESPIQAGRVGFAGGSHSMTTDAAEFWWSNSGRSPYTTDGAGAWCYVDGGTRRRGGEWPGAAKYQQGLCDSGR